MTSNASTLTYFPETLLPSLVMVTVWLPAGNVPVAHTPCWYATEDLARSTVCAGPPSTDTRALLTVVPAVATQER